MNDEMMLRLDRDLLSAKFPCVCCHFVLYCRSTAIFHRLDCATVPVKLRRGRRKVMAA